MDAKRLLGIFVLVGLAAGLQAHPPARAQTSAPGPSAVILLPSVSRAFDIGWVDPASHRYYLGDRTNAAIDVVDTTSNTLVTQIGGFVGAKASNDASGPDGVLVIPDANQLWAGDGDSTVKVIDLTTDSIIATISTGGTTRADEMAYDAADHIFIVTNDAETPPYVSLISTTSMTVLGKVPFPDATDGIEQPSWSADTGLFYQAVPVSKTNAGGEIDVIDPKTMQITGVFPLDTCKPAGTVIGPNRQLLAGCSDPGRSEIIDIGSGSIVATITQIGGSDEVWYNPGDNRYYLAASGATSDGTSKGRSTPTLGVIDAATNTWLMNVPTVGAAHSVAADPATNAVYVPIPNIGIAVYQIP
ncbi:MAG TPA: cytochrome C nitrite reductase [Dehalococcoidia bacterium]|nr:cytochrome C nitrite reductase [Dehalococcoidia bacterium]